MPLDEVDDQFSDEVDQDEPTPRPFLIFSLGDQPFALDVRHVREILDLQPMSQILSAPADIVGLIDLRGQAIPVADLGMRLGMQRSSDRDGTRILIVEASLGKPPLGLLVDKVESVQEIEDEALEPLPEKLSDWDGSSVDGVTRLSGRLTLVLSTKAVVAGHC